jgi:16S rRNA (guanine966-N2)-methyltransferase
MRIIAGELSGRIFNSPHGHRTHPMADRVRGGLFNALGDITDLTVLDAFAGTGALGFEALSRGAGRVLGIESDKSAQRTIQENIYLLNVGDRYKLVSATVSGWLTTSSDAERYDLIFADPPYHDLQLAAIGSLSERVSTNGLLVLSWPGKNPAPKLSNFDIAKQKSYGDAQLIFYRRVG